LDRGLKKRLIHGRTGGLEVVSDDEPIEEEDGDEKVEAKNRKRRGAGRFQEQMGFQAVHQERKQKLHS